ncbi:DUF1275 family protein [Nocardia stercoris]|uniref:DUF1275 domain-containing protein n=1 Tax=Nocardia stercoris TaxID=2483361 RepID=A0A3M2KZC5_9NOCA|nr:DUF1275 family protein [Nocardia stercoris]RMI28905.1 DUF1275 domain-containing protein [Nocardia stercoris]
MLRKFSRAMSATSPTPPILCLGTALGLQNATARALAIPDLTTAVLTLTLTGIAAAGGEVARRPWRRLVCRPAAGRANWSTCPMWSRCVRSSWTSWSTRSVTSQRF